jgi:diguanylate cyclase (GGDEF)-like protein
VALRGATLVAALIVGVIVGLILGYSLAAGIGSRERERAVREAVDAERANSARALARQHRELEEMGTRAREQADVFQILPDLVRQMFAVTGRRNVAPVALKLLNQLFHPAEAAVFHARNADRKLALSNASGLPSGVPPALEIEYGEGRIGHVAENRLAMEDADFRNATALTRRQLESTAHRELRAEVVAPMEDQSGLLGVLSIAGSRRLQGQEKRVLKMVADLTALALTYVSKLKTVQETADVDGLTGTYNKRSFQKQLGDEINRAEREHRCVSLFIMDIDHFKQYNDAHGHLEGDDVLKKVGQLLKASIRSDEDVAARYGGEEFVVLYPGATKALAYRLAQELRRKIESYPFAFAAEQPLGALTISGGVASFPEDAQSGVELIRAADQALYEAKRAGRNRVMGADPRFLS